MVWSLVRSGLGCRLLGGELAGRLGRFRWPSAESGGFRGSDRAGAAGEPLRAALIV